MFLHVFTFHSSPHFYHFIFFYDKHTSIKLIKMSSHILYPIVLQTAHTNIPMSQAIYIILSLRGLISTSVKIMDKWLVHIPISSQLHSNTKGKSNHLIKYTLAQCKLTIPSLTLRWHSTLRKTFTFFLNYLFMYPPFYLSGWSYRFLIYFLGYDPLLALFILVLKLSRVQQWKLLQAAFYVFLSWLYSLFEQFLTLWYSKWLICIFPAQLWNQPFSRSHDSFWWGMVFKK